MAKDQENRGAWDRRDKWGVPEAAKFNLTPAERRAREYAQEQREAARWAQAGLAPAPKAEKAQPARKGFVFRIARLLRREA